MEEFNRKGSDVDVLITSTKLGNLGQNMQHDCCDVVFVDTWPSAPNAAQCGGRVHRIEQTKICSFYTINLDHSYDQVIQASAANISNAAMKVHTRAYALYTHTNHKAMHEEYK